MEAVGRSSEKEKHTNTTGVSLNGKREDYGRFLSIFVLDLLFYDLLLILLVVDFSNFGFCVVCNTKNFSIVFSCSYKLWFNLNCSRFIDIILWSVLLLNFNYDSLPHTVLVNLNFFYYDVD